MDSSENAVSPAISNILNTVRCLLYSKFVALINVAADLKTTVDIFGLILTNTAILRKIVLNLLDTSMTPQDKYGDRFLSFLFNIGH